MGTEPFSYFDILKYAMLLTIVAVLTCRMSSIWPDDLALSVTYFLESSLTLAVVFGATLPNANKSKVD